MNNDDKQDIRIDIPRQQDRGFIFVSIGNKTITIDKKTFISMAMKDVIDKIDKAYEITEDKKGE